MSDEFGNWGGLSRLWHGLEANISPGEVEAHAHRRRRQMLVLAGAEAAGLALAFVAAMWIAMHTAYVAMSAISLVFFAVCGYLHHRMRLEPEPAGGEDLRSSLAHTIAREDWILRQLRVGRAVSLLTLTSLLLVDSDHLRYFTSTPVERLWALSAITLMVLLVLAWNLELTRRARRRRAQLDEYWRCVCGDCS